MKMEIQQFAPVQQGRPGSVHILMHTDDGRCVGMVDVWPVQVPAEDFGKREEFRVEVRSGDGPLSPTLDFRTVLK